MVKNKEYVYVGQYKYRRPEINLKKLFTTCVLLWGVFALGQDREAIADDGATMGLYGSWMYRLAPNPFAPEEGNFAVALNIIQISGEDRDKTKDTRVVIVVVDDWTGLKIDGLFERNNHAHNQSYLLSFIIDNKPVNSLLNKGQPLDHIYLIEKGTNVLSPGMYYDEGMKMLIEKMKKGKTLYIKIEDETILQPVTANIKPLKSPIVLRVSLDGFTSAFYKARSFQWNQK